MGCEISDKSQKRLVRILTLVFSVIVIALSLYNFLDSEYSFTVQTFMWNIYRILFAVVLIFAELNREFVLNRLGFLRHVFGKGMFLAYLGCITIEGFTLGTFIAIAIITTGIFMMCFNKKLSAQEQGIPEQQTEKTDNNKEFIK